MAEMTIFGETLDNNIVDTDFLTYWKTASSVQRRVSRAALVGATITGGGAIATGGNSLTLSGNSTLNGSVVGNMTGGGTIATGGFTLTVPATGTAALLATAQTFSALKTFSAGINLGNETLDVYDEGTWSPEITGSTSNPTVTYTFQVGLYTRIGNVVFYTFYIHINTISGGSGDIRVSLPVAVNSTTAGNGVAPARLDGVDVTNTSGALFVPTTSQSYGLIRSIADNGSSTVESISALAAGDVISVSGLYFANP